MSDPTEENPTDAPADAQAEVENQQHEIADVQDELDARAEGDGLAAEAGSGEETGLAEG